MPMIYLYRKEIYRQDIVLLSLIKVYASIQIYTVIYQLAVLKVVNYSFQNARSSPNFLHVIELDDFTKLLTFFVTEYSFSQENLRMWFENGQANEQVNPFLNIFDKFFPQFVSSSAHFIGPFDTNDSMIEMSNQGTLMHLNTEFIH